MSFHLDVDKIQWPPPGSFEANILRTIEVPYQSIDISRDQYCLFRLPALSLPPFKIDWNQGATIGLPATEEAT
jgi:hypothetical protein